MVRSFFYPENSKKKRLFRAFILFVFDGPFDSASNMAYCMYCFSMAIRCKETHYENDKVLHELERFATQIHKTQFHLKVEKYTICATSKQLRP